MRESQGPVSERASKISEIFGQRPIAGCSRSLRPSRAIWRASPCGSAPRSSPSQAAKTGPVASGMRGLTNNAGVSVRSLSMGSSSVPVPRPTQVTLSTQAGTSAPKADARSRQSSGRPCISRTIRKTAPASADPPPSPAATGRFFSNVTASPPSRGSLLSALATRLSNGLSNACANSPSVSTRSSADRRAARTSPALTNANRVSSS